MKHVVSDAKQKKALSIVKNSFTDHKIQVHEDEEEGGWFECLLCNKKMYGLEMVKIHIESKPHKNKYMWVSSIEQLVKTEACLKSKKQGTLFESEI